MKLRAILVSSLSALWAQDVSRLALVNCGVCHRADTPNRAPHPASLTEARVLAAFGRGHAAERKLSADQQTAIAKHYGRGAAEGACAADRTPATDSGYWNGWSNDPGGARTQPQALVSLHRADFPKLRLAWSRKLPGVASQPSLVAGRVYVGDESGALTSLDAETGCVYWKYQAEAAIVHPVSLGAIHSGRFAALFADGRANIYAVDAATGEIDWKTPGAAGDSVAAPPRLRDNRFYVPVGGGRVAAVHTESGRVLERTPQPSGPALSTTTTVTGVDFVVNGAVLEARDPIPPGWRFDASRFGPIRGGAVVAGGSVYLAAGDTVLAFRPEQVESGAVAQVLLRTDDGGVIWADQYGSGDRGVVLAHGGRFLKGSWTKQARELAGRGFRVLALDFRGYGQSHAPKGDDVHLDVLAAVRYLRTTGAKSVSVVGGSFGGGAAADAVALGKPGEIDRLALLGTGGGEQPAAKVTGRKLIVIAKDDANGDGPRLPGVRKAFDSMPEPKRLVVLDGSAHAQFLFETEHAPRVMDEIVRFLTEP